LSSSKKETGPLVSEGETAIEDFKAKF